MYSYLVWDGTCAWPLSTVSAWMHADVDDRIIASHLVYLERTLGPGAWRAAALDGQPLGLSALQLEEWQAVDAVPVRGALTVQFRLPRAAAEAAVCPTAAQLRALLLPNFASAAASDLWRMSLLRVAVATFRIDAGCGAEVRCAACALFPCRS